MVFYGFALMLLFSSNSSRFSSFPLLVGTEVDLILINRISYGLLCFFSIYEAIGLTAILLIPSPVRIVTICLPVPSPLFPMLLISRYLNVNELPTTFVTVPPYFFRFDRIIDDDLIEILNWLLQSRLLRKRSQFAARRSHE